MNQSVIEVNGVDSGDGDEEALVVLPVHDGNGKVVVVEWNGFCGCGSRC